MDPIKEAFQKAKEDINILNQEIGFLKLELEETRKEMIKICEIIQKISEKIPQKPEKSPSTHKTLKPTLSTDPSTHNLPLEALKPQNIGISTGNQGVSTDRQTDRQTDRKPTNSLKSEANSIDNAVKILDSLDNIKKEIRLKFKRLTDQELLVFSTLYQLDDETGQIDYKTLAKRINLTESSIRDYIGRLINKGIPVEKKRINNKTIHLSVSENLKKIASLQTILQLRDL
jgi:DNA-binding MarR family transcriptional regulator